MRLVFDENLAAILPGVEPASPDSPYPRAKDAKPWVDRHVTVWGELFYDDLTGRPAFLFVRELSDPRPNDDVFGNLSTGRRRELPRGTVVNPRLTLADVVGSIEMTDEEFQQALDDLREIRKAR
ncbi:hypothetical protein K8I61_16425 [bacterium]|nr:hypothetical protein [bacterium]